MGINVFPTPAMGGGGDSWELITTATPPGNVTELTFSNLSGYKSYRLVSPPSWPVNMGGSQSLRINNDSGFTWMYNGSNDAGWLYNTQNYITMGAYYNGSSAFTIDVSIECANLNAPKPISGFGISSASYVHRFRGISLETTPVTSITLFSNLNQMITVYLYGIPE